MRLTLVVSAVALLGWAGGAWAGSFLCWNCGIHCICPPPKDCPDCSCPCDQGLHHCSPRKSERAHWLIEDLCHGSCCDRIKAAEKLGCRLHADFCCDPEVLPALVGALLCDTCWEVRRAAAWSLTLQQARTEYAVRALYISSKMDHHFLVRDRAAEALDILTVCRKDCFKEELKMTDEAIKLLRQQQFKPGSAGCAAILAALDVAACTSAAIPQ